MQKNSLENLENFRMWRLFSAGEGQGVYLLGVIRFLGNTALPSFKIRLMWAYHASISLDGQQAFTQEATVSS
jgi:hypothetical protein